MKIKDEIQEKYYAFCNEYRVQIRFFDWFEISAHQNGITYPFKKSKKIVNPITMKNKNPEWKVDG